MSVLCNMFSFPESQPSYIARGCQSTAMSQNTGTGRTDLGCRGHSDLECKGHTDLGHFLAKRDFCLSRSFPACLDLRLDVRSLVFPR